MIVARLDPRQRHARPASGASWTLDWTKHWKGAHDIHRLSGEVRSVTGNASKRAVMPNPKLAKTQLSVWSQTQK
jgi:hypothetical protein